MTSDISARIKSNKDFGDVEKHSYIEGCFTVF